MVTQIELNHEQIRAMLADAAGAKPEDVEIRFAPTAEGSTYTATIRTDLKGATRAERTLDKYGCGSRP